jgi:hypothetical protein
VPFDFISLLAETVHKNNKKIVHFHAKTVLKNPEKSSFLFSYLFLGGRTNTFDPNRSFSYDVRKRSIPYVRNGKTLNGVLHEKYVKSILKLFV